MTRKDIHNSDLPVVCVACEARHRGICGALTTEELVTLAKSTRKVVHQPGIEIVGESENVDSYANVMRGVIKLSKMLEDGRQQVVGLQFAPDFIGRPFSDHSAVAAEAASEVETCAFPKSSLEHLIASNPSLEHRLLKQALRELDEARDWMVTLGRKTASEKVASFLMMISTHLDPRLEIEGKTATTFDLPLTRADIADFLGLTVETVSRQLTKLRADNVIEVTNNRHVVIADMARLERRCG